MAFLTKQEVQSLINESPEGVDAKDIVRGLRRKGHSLEGFHSPESPPKSPQEKQGAITGFAKGAGLGLINTLQNTGQMAMASPALFPGGKSFTEALDDIKGKTGFAPEDITPETTAERIGFTTEQFAEFLTPLGVAGAVPKVAISAPKLARLARFGVKSLAESGEFAVKATAQEGDFDSTAQAFVTGIAVNGLFGPATLLGRAATKVLPERLMSTIVKTSIDDLTQAYKTMARGKELNPTLARELLDRNFRGNTSQLATYSVKKLDDLERRVQNVLKQEGDDLMSVPNKKQYKQFLEKEVVDRFKTGFYRGKARAAKALIKELDETPAQQMRKSTALKTRRFIDDMRNTSSFRLDANLSPKQDQFKNAADFLRRKLAKDKRIAELMNEQRIFIEAFESVTDWAHKRANKQVIGLIDILAGGGGMASGSIVGGLTAAAAIRGFQQPFSLTNIAAFLDKTGKITAKTPQGFRDAMRAGITKTGLEIE